MPLVATAGAANANAYATVSEAISLLMPTIRTTFLDDDTLMGGLAEALIWATRLIDEQVWWYWAPVSTTQALAWPQSGAVNPLGQTLSTTAIPAFLKQATVDYAVTLLEAAQRMHATATMVTTAGLQGLKMLEINDVRMETADDLTTQMSVVAEAVRMPATVRRMLRPYGDVAGGETVRLVRT